METKSTFLEKMDTQMAEFNLKLDTLMAKSGHVDADAKPGYDERVKELREQRKIIEQKVNEMKERDTQGWEEQKTSIESSAAKLDQSLREALVQQLGSSSPTLKTIDSLGYPKKAEEELPSCSTSIF